MVGQNMGAQKPDRVRKILKYGLQLNLIIVYSVYGALSCGNIEYRSRSAE